MLNVLVRFTHPLKLIPNYKLKKMKAYAATKGITVVEATVSNVNDIQQAATNLVNQDVQAIIHQQIMY